MARYLGPKAKLSRREGTDLFLKSARRSISDKAKFDSKPGQHGRISGQRTSDFGLQLREKQKVKRIYGILERQFRGYFAKAERQRGVTGENLLVLLERRLDSVVYRLGICHSRTEARQLVRHGHVLVDGKRVDIPSYLIGKSQKIEVKEKSRQIKKLQDALKVSGRRGTPKWLAFDAEHWNATVIDMPKREDISDEIQEQLIVELYSK